MSTTDNAATSAAQPAEKPAAKSNYQVATMAIRHDGKAYQVGETIALTADQAENLGSVVVPLPATVKE